MKQGYGSHSALSGKKAHASLKGKSGTKRARGGKRGDHLDLEYFREARLFLAQNRATVTFYLDQEVASIHYDLQRDEIFYKGHNVKNMTLTEQQWTALQNFSSYLSQVPKSEKIRKAYLECLTTLLPRGII